MKTDVIIVGSGIIGMSLALSLSLKKKKVVIIEKNFSNALKINRVYSISEKTKNFFNDIEIWQDIASINRLNGMKLFYRKFNDNNLLSFSSEENNNNIGYIAQSKNIISSLLGKIEKDKNINILDNCEIINLDEIKKNVKVITRNNKTIEAEYLFSCEGVNSKLKEKLEIENIYDYYDSKALVFNISHEKSNKGIAYQIFLESGPVAFLPISSNLFSMVVSVKNNFFDNEKFSENNICKFIAKITNNKFGKIELITKLISFDLIGYDAERYEKGRVLFVGDSAHSVHPLAGMGLNLGVSDILEIMSITTKNNNTFDSGKFFSGYARKQKIVNKKARQQLKFIEKIYSIENSLANKIIRTAMFNMQKSNYLKEKIIKHANNNLTFF